MTSNRYTPPGTELIDLPKPPGSPIKAVLLGLLADMGGTLASGLALGMVYGYLEARAGVSAEDIGRAMAEGALPSWVTTSATVMGSAFSVLGGYVCARVSRRPGYKLGFILAAACVALGLLMAHDGQTMTENALLSGLTVVCVLVGIRLGQVKNQRPEP